MQLKSTRYSIFDINNNLFDIYVNLSKEIDFKVLEDIKTHVYGSNRPVDNMMIVIKRSTVTKG